VPTCLLVRHAHSSANGDGILAGRLPGIHLSERGREQAAALAARFRDVPVARIVTSPLERCAQTAVMVGEVADLEPMVDHDLQECAYGAWTGRALKDLAAEPLWQTVQDHPMTARFPDSEVYAAESLREMSARVVAAVRRHDAEVAAEAGPGALWVAVTHGDLVKAVLADATGAGLAHFQSYTADPASISVIRYGGRHTFLLVANDMAPELARFRAPEGHPPATDAVVGGTVGTVASGDGGRG
jgi:probable phosphomutase (TIGR03848 family)